MSVSVHVVRVFVDDNDDFGNPLGIAWSSRSTKKHEQQIAADLGFSETIFIDDLSGPTVKARIFTPTVELPFAGHPTVGLASWLRAEGDDITEIQVPAGSARVRVSGDQVFVNAMPGWCPDFALIPFESATDVDAIDPDAFTSGEHYAWAWIDEAASHVRARMFGPGVGVREDEATGAAAVRLTASLGQSLRITQGEGSQIFTHSRYLGQQVEVGGRTSSARTMELR